MTYLIFTITIGTRVWQCRNVVIVYYKQKYQASLFIYIYIYIYILYIQYIQTNMIMAKVTVEHRLHKWLSLLCPYQIGGQRKRQLLSSK